MLLYLVLSNSLQGKTADGVLGRLKSQLREGYERGDWSSDALFEAILPNLPHESQVLYQALGAAILDEQAMPSLEKNETWQKIAERPWFEG